MMEPSTLQCSDEPDDPQNAKRKKPPPFEDPITHLNEFEKMATHCEKQFAMPTSRMERLSLAARNFLGYCFLAETDLVASQVTLVVQQKEGKHFFWFERRLPDDPVFVKELVALRDKVRLLEVENAALKRKAAQK